MSESKIEKKAVGLIWEHLGIENSKLVTPGNTGYPDRIIWVPGGKPLLIEFKRPGEVLNPRQRYIHDKLKILGYRIEIHDDAVLAFSSVISTLEPTQLSKESREILARARRICSVLRSRPG